MTYVKDTLRGLVNKITGTGTLRDKTSGVQWHNSDLMPDVCDAMYSGSWVARKGVSIPAFDMLRTGWTWDLDDKTASKLLAAEKAMLVAPKVRDAITRARLTGGSGVLIGDGHPQPSEPLDYTRPVQYLTVLTRQQLFYTELDLDVLSPWYGEPKMYQITSLGGQETTVDIHPSRVARFIGIQRPNQTLMLGSSCWGLSALQGMLDSINAYAVGIKSTHRLLEEVSVNYHKIKGLLDALATEEGTRRVQAVVELSEQLASHVNARIIDADSHQLEQFKADFSGLPDVHASLLGACAAGFDVPLTRFLGQSPGGLNSTGESDLNNYYDMIEGDRNLSYDPPIMQVLRALHAPTFGEEGVKQLVKVYNPLVRPTPAQAAEHDNIRMTTLCGYVEKGLVPLPVAAKIAETELRSSSSFTGADEAYNLAGNLPDAEQRQQTETQTREQQETNDSRPMTLYVRRDVLNVEQIRAWAKDQGFASIIPNLHVTVVYSVMPGDWHRISESYSDTLTVPPGGPRSMELFGEAKVLQFSSSELKWRNEYIQECGFKHSFVTYSPHLTISYTSAMPQNVEPYQGPIELGPEVFEEIDQTYREKLQEQEL